MTERQLDQAMAQWAIQALARWALTVAVGLGALIVVGGADRWRGPTYAGALQFPAAPESWGYTLAAVGLVGIGCSLLGRLRGVAAALVAVSVWSSFFALSFVATAWRDPNAGTTGVGIYGFTAVVAALLAVVHWKSAPPRRR